MSILDEIAEIIGTHAAMRLGQHMGGARIYVLKNMNDNHPLALILGFETAKKLSYHYGGETIELPSKPIFRQERDRRIRDEYQNMPRGQGSRADCIALKYGLSRRRVLSIAKGH